MSSETSLRPAEPVPNTCDSRATRDRRCTSTLPLRAGKSTRKQCGDWLGRAPGGCARQPRAGGITAVADHAPLDLPQRQYCRLQLDVHPELPLPPICTSSGPSMKYVEAPDPPAHRHQLLHSAAGSGSCCTERAWSNWRQSLASVGGKPLLHREPFLLRLIHTQLLRERALLVPTEGPLLHQHKLPYGAVHTVQTDGLCPGCALRLRSRRVKKTRFQYGNPATRVARSILDSSVFSVRSVPSRGLRSFCSTTLVLISRYLL